MNPYEVLNIPPDAPASDVKKAYHKKATETHPDAGGTAEAFETVALAYNILIDPLKRREYDKDKKIHETRNLEKDAANLILSLFDQALSTSDAEANIIKAVQIQIKQKLGEVPIELIKIRRKKKETEKLAKQIKKTNDDFPDVIGLAIQNGINDMINLENKVLEYQKTLVIAKKMIAGYKFEPLANHPFLNSLIGKSFHSMNIDELDFPEPFIPTNQKNQRIY